MLLPVFGTHPQVFNEIKGIFITNNAQAALGDDNSQTMSVLQTDDIATSSDPLTIDDNALTASADTINSGQSQLIQTYQVRSGDTISGIAKMFNVSINTILWSNDLTRNSSIKEGETLVILPITGIAYTVKKGDTITSIAQKASSTPEDIESFNGILSDSDLAIGKTIIIPDGELTTLPVQTVSGRSPVISGSTSNPLRTRGGANGVLKGVSNLNDDTSDYFIRPIAHGIRTQGLHGFNAVDLANKKGTPILAAADGIVVISKSTGWNGGYGQYVVISHPNGMQTLYAHLSKNLVNVGDSVTQGQVIGKMGATGDATGPHVHFEVRGGENPFALGPSTW